MKRTILLILSTVLLGACATNIPKPIREAPPNSPTLEMLRGHVEEYKDVQARWGGTIASVENRPAETWLEIVSRPLQAYGRPAETGDSNGRFLARYKGFLDPMIFTKGRLITVVGKIEGEEQRQIDKFDYSFPVVAVDAFHLWEPLPPTPVYAPPYFFDPWWPYPYPSRYRHGRPFWW